VRVVYDGASEDRKLTGDALAGSTSGRLEKMGIEVRWVNKIMHHKLAIVDGPRDALTEAKTARVISGSGNWSGGAATRYDENTLFFTGYPEVTLRLQREFDTLWEHSRPIGTLDAVTPRANAIDDSELPLDPTTHATFTSSNFTPKNDTFYGNGNDTVSTMLVEAIRNAKKSIHVASGHLRSRPVSEALIAKHKASPTIDIQVLLDGQEYISRTSHTYQVKELETCLAAATTESQKRNCVDKGFLFGLQVADAGVAVRYKYYAYRWDVSYAKQMHHKYFVIDGEKLLTGSYNLSDNAEHDTFENVLTFEGIEFKALVASYEANFKKLWELGRNEGRLDALKTVVTTGATIPLVFEPLTIDWSEVTALKALIRENCPDADSEPFRTAPASHQLCER
jgi:phosphatidylserine/phosphatidylglycerophosphate/cardiolipin synthase-like enzyme